MKDLTLSAVKELQKDWCYTLYRDGDLRILSTVCGSSAIYEIVVVLDEAELAKYCELGEAYIEQLAREICFAPSKFRDRHIDVILP